MKQFIVLLFSIFIFIGCDRAVFETGGDSESLASGLEVVSEEEQELLADDQETNSDNEVSSCTENCANQDSGEELEDETDKNSDNDDHSNHDCEKQDCDHKHCRHGKKHKDTITPEELFGDEEILKEQGCNQKNREKKTYICHWPSADESKARTLCVSKNSLTTTLKKRRQDVYLVGRCSKDQITVEDLNN